MELRCRSCGSPFEAKRKSAKYCSSRCRQRAYEHPERTFQAVSELPKPLEAGSGPLTAATTAELEAKDRLGSPAGQAALALAQRVDAGQVETGSGMAALVKEYRATLADALKDVEVADDDLDQIRGSAALKLLRGGRS